MDGVGILRRRSKNERALALRLNLDHSPWALEERDLLPQDASVLLQAQAPAVDCEPGDVVSIGCRVAPALAVLEPYMEVVEVRRSMADTAARTTDLPQDNPDRPLLLHFVRRDVLALCGRTRGLPRQFNPQLEYAERLVGGAATGMPYDLARRRPTKAASGDHPLVAQCLLKYQDSTQYER